jgi:beta-lactamase class A
MVKFRVHLYYILAIIVLGSVSYYYINKSKPVAHLAVQNKIEGTDINNPLKLTSQKGFHLVQPLLKANQENESEEFTTLRARIQNLFEDNKRTGILTSSSVYLFSLSDGKWMYINPNEVYHPGSMMKMPMLLTYLKEADLNPEMLNKKFLLSYDIKVPAQTFTSSMTLEKGKSYTARELLKYMAAFSDNYATRILNENADVKNFVKTFTDLNIPEPNVSDRFYETSAQNMSEFFIVLYYATYISRKNSEYAMELLTECDFKEGMLRDLPANTKVAHKFGEWGDNRVNAHEMHEAGVVYLQNKPYLLTVVTKGSNSRDLAMVISKVSKLVYDDMLAISSAATHM